jgi:hypothetical protein
MVTALLVGLAVSHQLAGFASAALDALRHAAPAR